MKIRVVSSKEEIFTLDPNEKVVHLAFRPSNMDVFALVEACPKVEVIQLPESYRQTVSKAIEMYLEIQRIQLMEGDVWGHRKDIYEYYIIPISVIKDLKKLELEGAPSEEIEKIVKENKLTPEMITYMLSRDT
ncbi:hypothetical protein MSMTP_1958 [Methanosarcina sp. MTP4]|uniref:DUF1699 family protein n=1 Tax=Methanosarcina sp. MTP4 TaxID=1434100 RepID=UPI000615A5D7|nr:DUF1699 family protein [Methanosarcina sp. MTP4]AKB25427.1 hypothetical protein MSMTP_1958 [Methanosarcina sp. MTP4]